MRPSHVCGLRRDYDQIHCKKLNVKFPEGLEELLQSKLKSGIKYEMWLLKIVLTGAVDSPRRAAAVSALLGSSAVV